MGVQFVSNQTVFVGGYDISGQTRATSLEYGADMLDSSVLGTGTRTRAGGLKDVTFSHEGFWQAASSGSGPSDFDSAFFDYHGVSNLPVTIATSGSTEGGPAWLFRAIEAEYSPRGNIGELIGYNVSGHGDEALVYGSVLRFTTGLTSTGSTGTGVQFDKSSDSTVFHAALHVIEATNGSTEALTMTIESAASSGFTSPTTRISFTATTATSTYEYATFTAGTTEDWWRAVATSPTSSGEFHIMLSAGVSTAL